MLKNKIKLLINTGQKLPVSIYQLECSGPLKTKLAKIIDSDKLPPVYYFFDKDKPYQGVFDFVAENSYLLCLSDIRAIKEAVRKSTKSKIEEIKRELVFTSKIDWGPGLFEAGEGIRGRIQERNSCFWGGKSGARLMLQEEPNGFAVKAYDIWDTPTDRFLGAWSEDFDRIWLFNHYGITASSIKYQIAVFAGAISHVFDAHKTRHYMGHLRNRGSWDGLFHINNGMTGIIENKSIRKVNREVRYDLGWKDRVFFRCINCGIDIDMNPIESGGKHYCEKCANDNLFMCSHDMKLYHRRYMMLGPDGRPYYRNNISKVNHFVEDCTTHRYILRSDSKEIKPNLFCHKDVKVYSCNECGEVSINMDHCMFCTTIQQITFSFPENPVSKIDGGMDAFGVKFNKKVEGYM